MKMKWPIDLQIVWYDQTAIPSGVGKMWSLHEEGLSDPNTQTSDIKSEIRAENLAMNYDIWPEDVYVSCLLYPLLCI